MASSVTFEICFVHVHTSNGHTLGLKYKSHLKMSRKFCWKMKIGTIFLLTFCVANVLSESYFARNVCHNRHWSGKHFLRDVHQCTCEPYNEEDLKDKKSLIFFKVWIPAKMFMRHFKYLFNVIRLWKNVSVCVCVWFVCCV